MSNSARVALVAGLLGLLLCAINQLTAPDLQPALMRSSALAALLSVGLLLVSALWTRAQPAQSERAPLVGEEGLLLRRDLPESLVFELHWGSQLVLQATAAAVVMVVWNDTVLLRRGLCPADGSGLSFEPGSICRQVQQRGRSIHLVDLRHYPGRDEFTQLLADLPSVLVHPLRQHGLLLIGGWSPRCFSSSDQRWIEGWASRLTSGPLTAWTDEQIRSVAGPVSNAPANQEN